MQGESIFIQKLIKQFKTSREDVIMGIGDDAAVVKGKKDHELLLTCDSQVEGVHFVRSKITPQSLAAKAITAALSDIAAMGGVPAYVLISAAFPEKTDELFIEKLMQGFKKAANTYSVSIVGGNISTAACLILDIFVLGFAKPSEVVSRSGAKPGDAVLVTGTLGKSKVLQARIREGQVIATSGLATAMIDVSDGLSTDVLHICDASNVGVKLFAKAIPRVSPLDQAINGGEDYELLFTVNAKNAKALIARVKRETGTDVTIIGEVLPKKNGRWLIDENGHRQKLEARGWNHLKS